MPTSQKRNSTPATDTLDDSSDCGVAVATAPEPVSARTPSGSSITATMDQLLDERRRKEQEAADAEQSNIRSGYALYVEILLRPTTSPDDVITLCDLMQNLPGLTEDRVKADAEIVRAVKERRNMMNRDHPHSDDEIKSLYAAVKAAELELKERERAVQRAYGRGRNHAQAKSEIEVHATRRPELFEPVVFGQPVRFLGEQLS